MSDERESTDLSEATIDRLLREAPPAVILPEARRKVIWKRVSVWTERPSSVGPAARESRASNRRVWALAAAGVAVAAALVLVVSLSRHGQTASNGSKLHVRDAHLPSSRPSSGPGEVGVPVGRVEIVRGRCLRTGFGSEQEIDAGETVNAGDRVRVGPGAALRLRLADESEMWLCSDTEVVCVGARSNDRPALRLVRGELRAEITRSEAKAFSVETPAAMLRVLGTEFHCRVLPNIDKEDPTMQRSGTRVRNAVPAAVLVTVLSGAVAVQTSGGEQIVRQGQRAQVTNAAAPVVAEPVTQLDYIRRWLREPGRATAPEAMLWVPIYPDLLHALYAVNLDTGETRHITDVVGVGYNGLTRLGSDLGMLRIGSVVFSHFGDRVIGTAGSAFIPDQTVLLDMDGGEKISLLTPLRGYAPLLMALSPDRRKLAFVGDHEVGAKDPSRPWWQRPEETGLYVLDLETFQIKQVLAGLQERRPAWSPDSRWLSLSKKPVPGQKRPIVLIDTLTGNVIETGLTGPAASFTPDGKRVLFTSDSKETGTANAGVRTFGNLFLADVPHGLPEQLTHLAEGEATQPAFSPDGSRLAYWEPRRSGGKPGRLHLVEMNSRKDEVVIEGRGFSDLEWLTPNSRLLATMWLREEQRVAAITLIERTDGAWNVREVTPVLPEPTAEQKAAGEALAQRIFEVFSVYREASQAQELDRIEEAQRTCSRARDLMAAIVRELSTGSFAAASTASASPLRLQSDDLKPYLDELTERAALTVVQRTIQSVYYKLSLVGAVLGNYVKQKNSLPPDIDALVRWAPSGHFQINDIRSDDMERIRRRFIVPGDDPERVTTSFQTVERNEKEGLWVVQTPMLPNGKRLQAKYTITHEGSRVRVTSTIDYAAQ